MTTLPGTQTAHAGLTVRRAADRGRTGLGWLDSRHTFSFGGYIDREHVSFRSLRVINDDRVAPGGGFGTHGHADMEIVSYIVSGSLAHKDSLGNGSTLVAGDVQRMTAGSGIKHSEFNPSETEPTRFLQIWIIPEKQGLEPGYDEMHAGVGERAGELVPIVTRSGRDGSLKIRQDVEISAAVLEPGNALTHASGPDRHTWVQVVRGDLTINGVPITEGDGVAVDPGIAVSLTASSDSEVLVFDLA